MAKSYTVTVGTCGALRRLVGRPGHLDVLRMPLGRGSVRFASASARWELEGLEGDDGELWSIVGRCESCMKLILMDGIHMHVRCEGDAGEGPGAVRP